MKRSNKPAQGKRTQVDAQGKRTSMVPPAASQAKTAKQAANKLHQADRLCTLSDIARLVLCLMVSALGFYLIGWIIFQVYHPNTAPLLEEAKTLLPDYMLNSVKPEPHEDLLYNLGLLYFPLSLLGLYHLFSLKSVQKLWNKPWVSTALIYIFLTALGFLAYWVLRQSNPFLGEKYSPTDFHANVFKVYFAPWLMAQKPVMYVWITLVTAAVFYILSRLNDKVYKLTDLILGMGVNVLVIWLLMVVFQMNHYAFPDAWQGQYDFNSVYYSMTQTMAGSPVLIDGVSNTYGGYPLFLVPVFKFIEFNISNFTLVMGSLLVMCVVGWAVFLNRFTRSRLIAACGLTLLLFFGYLTAYLHDHLLNSHSFDSYFANAPIRWVAPTLALVFAVLYNSSRKVVKAIGYYGGALILPLGIVWSPDSGLISCLAFLMFLMFRDFWKDDLQSASPTMPQAAEAATAKSGFLSRVAWPTLLLHLAVWVGGLLVSLGGLALGLRLAYHAWPEYGLLFRTALIFGKLGFFTMPMQLYHPWMLVVLFYGLGLVYSLSVFYRGKNTAQASAVFLLSILGCGLFAYFKSRSYHSNLMQPAFYAVMIGVILTDQLYWQVRTKKLRALYLPCLIGLVAVVCALPESMAARKPLQDLTRAYHGNTPPEDKARIYDNKAFIQKCTRKTPKVWVLTSNKYQSFYFDRPLLQSAFNPGFLDLNTLEDYRHALQVLRDSNHTVFLDGYAFYYSQWSDFRALLAARYVPDTQALQPNKSYFTALNPRGYKVPSTPVLKRSGETALFYRKYADDSAGYALRMQDAAGNPLVLPQTGFSVEAVFHTGKQHYSRSSLFSQYTDTSGIGMFHINEEGQNNLFGLACGHTQRLFYMPENTWVYVVFNFLPGAVDLYVNAQYYGRILLDAPYRQGSDRFYIGTHQNNNPYFGAISEFAIHHRLKTDPEVHNTYERFLKEK